MKSADIIKRLKAEGWVKVGGKGDHEKFKHPDKPEIGRASCRERVFDRV